MKFQLGAKLCLGARKISPLQRGRRLL